MNEIKKEQKIVYSIFTIEQRGGDARYLFLLAVFPVLR